MSTGRGRIRTTPCSPRGRRATHASSSPTGPRWPPPIRGGSARTEPIWPSTAPEPANWPRSSPRRWRRAEPTPRGPLGCGSMDARTFLGMEPVADDLHWQMRVEPRLTTPGNFLFGGCALGGALVALEEASGRPTIWATGQYLSYAPTHSLVEWEITLAVVGSRVTQGRAVGMVGE